MQDIYTRYMILEDSYKSLWVKYRKLEKLYNMIKEFYENE